MDGNTVNSNCFTSTNVAIPPPTIWNANTILLEPEVIVPKSRRARLETITEGFKKNFPEKNNSKIPVASTTVLNSTRIRNEPVTLTVPASSESLFNASEPMLNYKNKKFEEFLKNNAASVIQRAYKRYSKKKRIVEAESFSVQQSISIKPKEIYIQQIKSVR